MPDGLQRIIPAPQPEIEEHFSAYQTTSRFYREVESRSEFKRHCEWYYATALAHRRKLQQMQGELNVLSWFRKIRF